MHASFVLKVADDGKTLIVVNMASGELFAVDPENGKAALIDLGGVLVHGDGLVRNSTTATYLYKGISYLPTNMAYDEWWHTYLDANGTCPLVVWGNKRGPEFFARNRLRPSLAGRLNKSSYLCDHLSDNLFPRRKV